MEKMRVILIAQFLFIGAAVAAQVDIGKIINPMLNTIHNQPQAYESPRFRRFVIHCSSHIADTCSSNDAVAQHPDELANCLFNSMETCLVDHGATLYGTTGTFSEAHKAQTPAHAEKPNYLDPHPFLAETLKFQTVLRNCTRVSARSCWSGPDVSTSVLAACLIPSMNQCVYPRDAPPSMYS
ncbi:hypothetical protein VNO77_29390 [Canavalia gladiata]|uniref:Uncharacterized protein n=1 Tax=Canavalia gladiata TaxID=3824 RepID=A0AAN9KXP4_CANGL